MNKNKQERPTNEKIIEKYLNIYQHSKQSVSMRKSSLKYFFGEPGRKCYGYQKHIFDMKTRDLMDYFIWLKNLDLVSISTRKNKWHILTSLLNKTMDYYHDDFSFFIRIPKMNWKGAVHKEGKVKTNADVYANKEEIEKLLQYFKNFNFKHYLIFRILTDTGMRKGTLLNMKIGDVHLEERYFHTRKGKTGEKIYPFREDLAKFLKIYINNRKEQDVDNNVLFLTKSLEPYGLRSLNDILEYARNKIGIEKRITTKTFRKTLNDYRKKMGCHKEDREMLLGHKPSSVNTRNYTPKPKDYGPADLKDHIQTYDRWYPYQDINI